ncbi:MAG: HNH endonuclease [Clostridia bacterium]|nr:HNH endonuclease [Clostridia bacterium]
MEYKLNFELVPDGCWYSNLRTILSKKQWDFLRAEAKERAGGKCMICGRESKRLEAHERWSYDAEKGVQKLEDIVAVCKDCHSVIHIGRTQLKGDEQRAEKHFMKVNGCSYVEYRKALGIANEKHKKLNQVPEWKLDLSYFKRYITDEKE